VQWWWLTVRGSYARFASSDAGDGVCASHVQAKRVRRAPCAGSHHLIPIPRGYTAEAAWREVATLGTLVFPTSTRLSGWVNVHCPGGDARCQCREVRLGWWWRLRRWAHGSNPPLPQITPRGQHSP
jgi:hypothetical protein